MAITLTGPDLTVTTATRRLISLLGARDLRGARAAATLGLQSRVLPEVADGDDLHVDVSWYGRATLGHCRPGGEAAVQAMSGLMHVHGRDAGVPRRLGLEVASVAAGVLAAQSVLASLVGRERGQVQTRIETSVLEAALQLTSHYVAAATCRDRGEWRAPKAAAGAGPPFRSADGRWFEIETLDPEAWRRFWFALGAVDLDLSNSWTQFRARYFRGECALPPEAHTATASHGMNEISRIARECRVSVTPVRTYPEVLADPVQVSELATIEDIATPHDARVPDPGSIQRGALPLRGVEVVEATSRIQGPLAGLLLQMLGAHVVRVEPPGGDPFRLVPPYAASDGYFFTAFNRGKDVRELNVKTPEGRHDLLDLLSGADIFIHNWAPGKADAWELSASSVAHSAPRMTYVETSGWGNDDRNGRMVGTEFLVQALSGLAAGLTPHGPSPAPSRALLVDCLGALVACEGALAGLLRASRSGRGAHVRASLMAGAMALQTHVLDAFRDGDERSRYEGRPLWHGLDRPLRTADGFIAVDLQHTGDVYLLGRALGVAEDASAAEAEFQIAHRIARSSAHQCEETLTTAGIACSTVVEDLAALPRDERLAMLFDDVGEGCRVAATPWRFAA